MCFVAYSFHLDLFIVEGSHKVGCHRIILRGWLSQQALWGDEGQAEFLGEGLVGELALYYIEALE